MRSGFAVFYPAATFETAVIRKTGIITREISGDTALPTSFLLLAQLVKLLISGLRRG